MSKLDATGAKSLEEILASIRKTLSSGDGSDASSGQRSTEPKPVPATPEPKVPAAAERDDDGQLSARLAGALNGPLNGAALDDDVAELLAPEQKAPAQPGPAAAAKPADAASEGKDALWFLKQPPAGANSAQPGEGAPATAEEVKLSRPEVLRASLPPLFGAEERPPVFRTASAQPLKTPDSGIPTAKRPPPPPPGETGTGAASSMLTARTQPRMPPEPPVDETAEAVAETAPAVREPAPARESPPASVAETASGPQPVAESRPANGQLGDVAADTAAKKAPTQAQEPAPAAAASTARTLEQVIGELLEPVIRQWLESNLPRMVQTVVREEVARAIAAERGAPKV